MTFQFQCPNGDLLEGEESQVGKQCTCPICQTLFVIPAPLAAAAAPPPPPEEPAAVIVKRGDASRTPGKDEPAGKSSIASSLLHILCPEGHELEVPREMLDQLAACPHCGKEFKLRERDSIEWKRRHLLSQEKHWNKAGQFWLNLAIVVAVATVLGLILLIALMG